MNLLHHLQNTAPLSQSDGQQSWRTEGADGQPKFIRLFRLPEPLIGEDGRLDANVVEGARLGQVPGVARWRRFEYLTKAQQRRMGLSDEHWLLAVRDFIAGESLRARRSTGAQSWLDTTLAVVFLLRGLHERGWAHGDLQPKNIIAATDESLWLVDVPLFASAGGHGQMADSAPLMAPERWEGEPASVAADVYSLGMLVCWLASGGSWPLGATSLMQWARGHRHGRAQVPAQIGDQLGEPLSELIGRMLSKEPQMRPPLQALIDAALDLGASAEVPAAESTSSGEIDRVVESAVEALDDGAPAVVVVDRDRKLIASSILSQLARRLELTGERVLHLRGDAICGGLVHSDEANGEESNDAEFGSDGTISDTSDSWELAYSIIETLSGDADVRAHLAEQASLGDRLHTFDVFAEALFAALLGEGLTVVWEDFVAAGSDIARWWDDVMDRVAAGAAATDLTDLKSVLGAAPVRVDENVVVLEPSDGRRDELLERFYSMLSLNESLLDSTDLEQLASEALEYAVSLSGAERGYFLLRDSPEAGDGGFRVIASRDVRGQSLAKPHLETSLKVAEEAARTGQSLIIPDARDDAQFESADEVELTSVLCVLIRDSGGLLGSLYLDHRFELDVFDGELPRMIEAFGRQVALAIRNLRRIEDLRDEISRAKTAKTMTPERGRKPKATRPEVVEALRRADGDRDEAADALGVSLRTLYRYLKKYEIE